MELVEHTNECVWLPLCQRCNFNHDKCQLFNGRKCIPNVNKELCWVYVFAAVSARHVLSSTLIRLLLQNFLIALIELSKKINLHLFITVIYLFSFLDFGDIRKDGQYRQ